MSPTAIGVDIGGTNLRAGRVSVAGVVEASEGERISRDPEAVFERIAALCRRLDDGSAASIGIGIPGRVDARRSEVLSGGYLDFGGFPLAERLRVVTGRPVWLDNDCNMALVAEMATGAARGVADVVMFTIGTGIGGAVATEGAIVRGRATAGQLGHLSVERNGRPCQCGRSGCVETTSSGTALGRLIAEAGLPVGTDIDGLFARDRDGDAKAASVLDRWILPLRDAIDSMVAALDPGMVILGGGLGASARQALDRAPPRSPWYQCRVEAAQLGDAAGVIGAGLAAFRSIAR